MKHNVEIQYGMLYVFDHDRTIRPRTIHPNWSPEGWVNLG